MWSGTRTPTYSSRVGALVRWCVGGFMGLARHLVGVRAIRRDLDLGLDRVVCRVT
jgi:hypothetical protein